MKYEDLVRINQTIKTTPIKGKDYAEVNQRIKAFRQLFPMGCIRTEVVSLTDGVVVMQASILDENGSLLATGTAYEKEGSTNINRTSYIENCETSAVGRALGMLGIGIDVSVASYEEVQTAILQQEQMDDKRYAEVKAEAKVEKAQIDYAKTLCAEKGMRGCPGYDGVKWEDMTIAQYEKAIAALKGMKA